MTNVPHGGLAISCIFPLGSVIRQRERERKRERERERERVSPMTVENNIS